MFHLFTAPLKIKVLQYVRPCSATAYSTCTDGAKRPPVKNGYNQMI